MAAPASAAKAEINRCIHAHDLTSSKTAIPARSQANPTRLVKNLKRAQDLGPRAEVDFLAAT